LKRRSIPAVEQLCPHCGLCCDSTLFADAELRPDDDAKGLARLGLILKKKGGNKLAFEQPCACFDGTYCKIYGERPVQCRLFECGLLKRTASGEMNADAALKKIAEAKGIASRVRTLLSDFGQRPDKLALTNSYSKAMRSPIELSQGDDAADRQGQLMEAYGELMELVEREFLR
jgi:Fe-S-cluster containining protein